MVPGLAYDSLPASSGPAVPQNVIAEGGDFEAFRE